jgi:MATE family multidrug resistance protein
VYSTTVILLRFVAFYCMFDAMYTVFAGTLKGAGDTRFILWTTLITSGITTLVTWLGLERWGFGLWECWFTITAWVCALGIIYLARFLQGTWRSMRIIEPALEE